MNFPNWNLLQFELLRIYGGKIRPGGRGRRVDSRVAYQRAWLLLRGNGEYRTADFRQTLTSGEWAVPPADLTWQDFSADAELISIHFHARWPDGTPLFEVANGLKWPAKRHPDLERTARHLVERVRHEVGAEEMSPLSQPMDLPAHLEIDRAFRAWIGAFCESMRFERIAPTSPARLDDRIREALQWLNQFPLSAKFRTQALADHLGLSVVHLNRLFARELQRSPGTVFEQRRWERAVHLLQYSRLSVKEIAFELGFAYPSYFTAWVRERSGKSPKAFRQVAD